MVKMSNLKNNIQNSNCFRAIAHARLSPRCLKKEKKHLEFQFFFFFFELLVNRKLDTMAQISKEIYFHDYDLCIQAKCMYAQVGIVGLSPIRILLTGNRFLFPKVILIALNPVINSVRNTIFIFQSGNIPNYSFINQFY